MVHEVPEGSVGCPGTTVNVFETWWRLPVSGS